MAKYTEKQLNRIALKAFRIHEQIGALSKIEPGDIYDGAESEGVDYTQFQTYLQAIYNRAESIMNNIMAIQEVDE